MYSLRVWEFRSLIYEISNIHLLSYVGSEEGSVSEEKLGEVASARSVIECLIRK